MRRVTAEIWDEGRVDLVDELLRFEDGRATERWGVHDTMAMADQLAMLG
jgi:hypothetical protein